MAGSWQDLGRALVPELPVKGLVAGTVFKLFSFPPQASSSLGYNTSSHISPSSYLFLVSIIHIYYTYAMEFIDDFF